MGQHLSCLPPTNQISDLPCFSQTNQINDLPLVNTVNIQPENGGVKTEPKHIKKEIDVKEELCVAIPEKGSEIPVKTEELKAIVEVKPLTFDNVQEILKKKKTEENEKKEQCTEFLLKYIQENCFSIRQELESSFKEMDSVEYFAISTVNIWFYNIRADMVKDLGTLNSKNLNQIMEILKLPNDNVKLDQYGGSGYTCLTVKYLKPKCIP